jgi:hypothetical protein
MATLADLQAFAAQQAQEYGIPVSLFEWQIGQESGWNPNAQNGNASGIAQFMPGTAAEYGVNTSDPYSSITGAAQLDADLFNQSGSWQTALTQYGTLANVPASVMQSFQNVMANLGLSSTSATSNTGSTSGAATSPGAVATSDSFITKIAMIVLGIVLIGGAIVVYRKS